MEKQANWSANILYLLAWLVCSVLVIVDILAIREAALDVVTAARAASIESSEVGQKVKTEIDTGFTMLAIDQGILFLGGVVAVVFAIGIEYYFRIGKEKGVLLKRVGLVVGIQIAIFIASVAIQTLV